METKAHKNSMGYLFFALLAAMALAFVAVMPVSAQETGTEVEIAGTVVAIDEAAGTFTVETEGGETYIVFPGEDFDLSALSVGDKVEVKGTLNEDGSVSATEVRIEEQDDTTDEEDPSTGFFCVQSEIPHPFGALLAERYEVEYATLQAWFCDGFGWGQIMLALQTGKMTGSDPGELLELRRGGAGWGRIWQELKLIGKPNHAGPPNDADGDGKPDHAGPPKDKDGDGKPDHAGPLDGKGPPAGRP